MKKTFLYLILAFLILSCNEKEDDDQNNEKEGEYQYPSFITTGQNFGEGIRYIDIEPDDTMCDHYCYPYATKSLDLDNDNIFDFELKFEMSDPFRQSSGYSIFRITPLENNSVCVSGLNYNWVESLVFDDTIGYNSNWSDTTALLYSCYWYLEKPSQIEGYWYENDNYFVGIKIPKKDYQMYGWIDVDFHGPKIKQYAITIPYLK